MDVWQSPAAERGLVLAAAAIAAGEPKRELRELAAPDIDGDMAVTLGNMSHRTDRNWFPGDSGAQLASADFERLSLLQLPNAMAETSLGRPTNDFLALLSLRAWRWPSQAALSISK